MYTAYSAKDRVSSNKTVDQNPKQRDESRMLAIIVKAIDGVGRNSECQSIDIENAPAGQSKGKKKTIGARNCTVFITALRFWCAGETVALLASVRPTSSLKKKRKKPKKFKVFGFKRAPVEKPLHFHRLENCKDTIPSIFVER